MGITLSEKATVYFCIAENGYLKIGVSRDMKRRVARIRNASASPIIAAFGYEYDAAGEVEKSIHYHFDDFRSHGEWFLIPSLVFLSFAREMGYIFDDELLDIILEYMPPPTPPPHRAK